MYCFASECTGSKLVVTREGLGEAGYSCSEENLLLPQEEGLHISTSAAPCPARSGGLGVDRFRKLRHLDTRLCACRVERTAVSVGEIHAHARHTFNVVR